MQIHNLIQGSPEWLAYRSTKFNASDAPAMMGVSPYKSRTELLHERFVGMAKEVDAGTQMRFDDGHRFEALARGLAEGIVGADLYPVTGSLGEWSASFDGITMGGDIIWEHKTINDEIRAVESSAGLGAHYRIQMEQQLLVSDAEKCLFLASKWDNNDNLVDSIYFWYESDEALRREIIAGWAQFATDLAAYEPKELPAKQAADPIMQLPALSIQIRGEVTVSNLPMFKAKADQFIASIKTDLLTDEDFANAEETIKFCDKAEKNLELAKGAAIAQTASIDDLMRTIDHIGAQLREKRLLLTRTVKDKKELLKADILNKAKLGFLEYATALEAEIAPLRLVYQMPDFAGAMKSKRTLATLHDAVDTEMASAKIGIDANAKAIRARSTWYTGAAAGYGFLFADLQTIIQKSDDDFKLLVNSRIDAHKADEAAKLEADRARIAEEERAKLAVVAEPVAVEVPAPIQAAAPSIARLEVAQAAPEATPPTLRLGQIADRLGFALTAEFLRSLGFDAAERNKGAVLYHEAQFSMICAALSRHISAIQAKQAA